MNFIAFDLETTGIAPEADRIVELGAVRFVDGEPQGTFTTLVNPECPIPFDASRVSGITDDMVRGQPKITEVLPKFADFCGDLDLVAHNAKFDYRFVLAAVKRHKTRAPEGVVLDTFALGKKIYPGMSNYRLGTLVDHFKIPSGTFHRAEEDAGYCGLVFIKIIEALKASNHACDVPDLIELMEMPEMRFPQFAQAPEQLGLF
ncbi:MAG: 3'-5' exonuclease [Verrucomicrobia bacterium]|nr:3'-5' exonuclease [Verrucomicrobiota bacterium]